MYSDTLAALKPIHIAGGSKSLFIVSFDGKVKFKKKNIFFLFFTTTINPYCLFSQLYACGEGTNGRLGLGHSNNVPSPCQITSLNQYVIKKVAVHSGGKHAMALTLDGKVGLINFLNHRMN